jgi:hypothetical protein
MLAGARSPPRAEARAWVGIGPKRTRRDRPQGNSMRWRSHDWAGQLCEGSASSPVVRSEAAAEQWLPLVELGRLSLGS